MPKTTERFPASYDWRARFPNAATALLAEGGAVYVAEDPDGERYWSIRDESTLAEFDLDDDAGLASVGVTEHTGQSRKREFVAEIVELRRFHDEHRHRPDVAPSPHREALAGLVDDVAARVAGALGGARTIGENRHIKDQVKAAAADLSTPAGRPAVKSELKVAQDIWAFGHADFALTWPKAGPVLIETKSGSGTDATGELVWDSAKLALLLQRRVASGAFLLACAPVADWERPVRGAEFGGDHSHDAEVARVLHADWWRHWEKCGDPQPKMMPRAWRTELVHAARIDVHGTPWELRLAEVLVADTELIGWPPLTS